jgi:hypothetical protein
MQLLLRLISYFGLVLTVVPSFLMFAGRIDRPVYLNLLIAGMILWFGSGVFWIKKDHGM